MINTALKYRQQSPWRGMGSAHWEPKAISPFALQVIWNLVEQL